MALHLILCVGMYTDTLKPEKPVCAFLARHAQSWQALARIMRGKENAADPG